MKKIKQIILCFMLVFAMALVAGCGSNKDKVMESTIAPTTSATSGVGTGPTGGVDSTESTGVIDGMTEDMKKGASDVKDGVEDALDMTTGGETKQAH